MTAKIVIVGSFNTDLTTYMARLPRPGETVHGRQFVTGPGGKGSNQAVAAARLGAQVAFVGCVGQDAFAQFGLDIWRAEGINTDYVVHSPDHATGVAPIFVEDSGENMIAIASGANLAITPADVEKAADAIAEADILVVQLEINYAAVQRALEIAREQGTPAILNPAPAPEHALPPSIISLADYITPNETELESLAGSAISDVEAAARALLRDDRQTVVVTLGGAGARWVRRGGTGAVSTFSVDVVDTTGAGDAFNGGLAVALAEGRSLEDAVRFANATAAMCVTRPGTARSMPQRSEVDALLAS